MPAGSAKRLELLYGDLYSLTDQPDTMFDKLLERKEAFAEQCFQMVVTDHVPVASCMRQSSE